MGAPHARLAQHGRSGSEAAHAGRIGGDKPHRSCCFALAAVGNCAIASGTVVTGATWFASVEPPIVAAAAATIFSTTSPHGPLDVALISALAATARDLDGSWRIFAFTINCINLSIAVAVRSTAAIPIAVASPVVAVAIAIPAASGTSSDLTDTTSATAHHDCRRCCSSV